MPRTSRAVSENVTPAFRAFLAQVTIPRGKVTEAMADATGVTVEDPRRRLYGKSSDARYLHKLLDAGIGLPSPSKAWQAAEAAFALGNDWCAGPLFLFAAGHLGEFAVTLAAADETLVERRRKATLVTAASTACNPAQSQGRAQLRDVLRHAGVPETIIQSELRNLQADTVAVRPDQLAWILTSAERAAFHSAFLKRTDDLRPEYSVAVETSRLAAAHPELGVDMQREVAVTALWHAFSL